MSGIERHWTYEVRLGKGVVDELKPREQGQRLRHGHASSRRLALLAGDRREEGVER